MQSGYASDYPEVLAYVLPTSRKKEEQVEHIDFKELLLSEFKAKELNTVNFTGDKNKRPVIEKSTTSLNEQRAVQMLNEFWA